MTDVDWLREVQEGPASLSSQAPQLASLLAGKNGRTIQTAAEWEPERQLLREQWRKFLGRIAPSDDTCPEYDVLEREALPNVERLLIRYETEPGWQVEAYLLRPRPLRGPAPGVMVFHSTVPQTIRQPAGIEGAPEKAFGLWLAERGHVVLCPRCFLWRDGRRHIFLLHAYQQVRRLRKRHGNIRGMAKLLHDAQRSLDVLAGMPEVDAQRMGAVGHSLGAKQVLYLTALDDRVRAAVSSEGGVGRTFSNWAAPWYLGRRTTSSHSAREHHELLGLIAPRAFLLIGGNAADGDHSWPFVAAALAVYQLYPGPPRLGLLNHRQGHTVPASAAQRIYEWFDAYL